jgi:hypothetical protein
MSDSSTTAKLDVPPTTGRTSTGTARSAFLGPWLAVSFPRSGILRTASAPRGALILSMVVHGLLFGPLIILLASYEKSAHLVPISNQAGDIDPATPGLQKPPSAYEVRFNPLGNELAKWFVTDRELARTGYLCVFTFVAALLYCAGLIPLLLPRVKRNNSLADAAWSAYAIPVSQLPFLLCAATVVGVTVAQMRFWSLKQRVNSGTWMRDFDELVIFACVVLFSFLLLLRLQRAAHVLGMRIPVRPPATVCEHCGYDLTHVSRDGLCTECGHTAQDSLTEQRRSGVEWESGDGAGIVQLLKSWIRTSNELLLQPRSFYQRLHVTRSPARAEWFAWLTYTALALFSWAWVLTLFIADQRNYPAPFTIRLAFAVILLLGLAFACARRMISGILVVGAGMLALLPFAIITSERLHHGYFASTVTILSLIGLGVVPMLAWVVNRAIGGIMSLWWFWRGHFHDDRGAEKVVAYESAFLWLPWLWFMLLFTSFIFFDSWMSEFVARLRGINRGMLAAIVEPAVVVLGWAALVILWMFRFSRAAALVRWANR